MKIFFIRIDSSDETLMDECKRESA